MLEKENRQLPLSEEGSVKSPDSHVEYPELEIGAAALKRDIDSWEQLHPNKRTLVLVGGPTAAGKDRFASMIVNPQDTTILELDRYYLSPQEQMELHGTVNFSPPAALDTERLNADVEKILGAQEGESVSVPIYSMTESKRTGDEPLIVKKRILVNGVYALQVTAETPFRVYVDAPEEVLLARKLVRDVQERGIAAATVLERFEKNVRPAIRDHVAPQKKNAQYIIHNDANV